MELYRRLLCYLKPYRMRLVWAAVFMLLSSAMISAQTYLVNYGLPNFYFHTSMAYAIARKNGVPVGKANFMGRE